MPPTKLNILVYAGNGSTIESVRHCLWSLRRLLSPNYAVIPISSDAVLKEPWTNSCALFVMPGGADLGYCRTLDGHGNRKITSYVTQGGSFLGFCAGGYYGSRRCEFELGNPSLEVAGSRELGFFPGTCRGCAYRGFVYHSEAGARAVTLNVNKDAFAGTAGSPPDTFKSYYNGGGAFVDADKMKEHGIETLASYADALNINAGEGRAAVVYRQVGSGGVILTGPHPEFAPINLPEGSESNPNFSQIKAALTADDAARLGFLKAALIKLGLKVTNDGNGVPSLSRLHLSSSRREDLEQLERDWVEDLTEEDNQTQIICENDTFTIEHPEVFLMDKVKAALPDTVTTLLPSSAGNRSDDDAHASNSSGAPDISDEGIVDYDKIIKRMVVHRSALPETKETPCFNHHAYFSNLSHYNTISDQSDSCFGRTVLYAEVITSTSTILEKNLKLLQHLPTGTTATATTQVAGRGRGSNVWVSPPGALMFSTVLRHPLSATQASPVVLVQYLAALAVVTGIRSYDTGYDAIPIRLKWPNDVYVLDPTSLGPGEAYAEPASTAPLTEAQRNKYVKVSGIMVNSSYTPAPQSSSSSSSSSSEHNAGFYTLVAGIGINVSNAAPVCSLNQILAAHFPALKPFALERLLASILNQFEVLYDHFCQHGFDAELLGIYHTFWLHTDQIVTITAREESGEPERRARVKRISPEWGFLVAEELVGEEEWGTGRMWELQSDANSFDFFKGLLLRKK